MNPEHLKEARQILAREGGAAFQKHVRVARMCGCRDCFCCAAAAVWDEQAAKIREAEFQIAGCVARRYSCERDGRIEEARELSDTIARLKARVERLRRGGEL